MTSITDLLQMAIEKRASDLHIVAGYFPFLRINNELFPLRTLEQLTKEHNETLLLPILTEEQKENFLSNREIDFGYEFNGNRFRVNYYYQRNSITAAFRIIPASIKTPQELNLPQIVSDLTKQKHGLILITGPTGEGKSTTLASMINEINMRDSKHIVAIEDPIEFIYPPARSIVSQRELHQDTHSWNIALRSVLREDPDVVLIGEMRDLDTIQAAITIAETGHLVFATLHTGSTPEAIDRIVDVFPGSQQNQIKSQLASVLRAVIAQRLLPTYDNTSRVPALEILINIPAVSALIREGKTFMIDNVIQTAEENGMVLFERYIAQLFQQNRISRETAISYALRPNEISKFIT